MPSLNMSSKMFTVGNTLGGFTSDRTHGILGRLGQDVPMVPIAVSVGDTSYSYECVRHPVLLPILGAYLAQASQTARGRRFGDQTVQVNVSVEYQGQKRIEFEEIFSGAEAGPSASGLVSALLAYLENSPFAVPQIERINVSIRAAETLKRLELIDAVPSRLRVQPGESIVVRIRFRSFGGAELVRKIGITIPSEAREGRLDLVVASGASWTEYDLRMRPLLPRSFDDEIRLVDRLVPSTRLVVALESRDSGVVLRGGHVSVPVGLQTSMKAGLGSELHGTGYRAVEMEQLDLNTPIIGAKRIPLQVRRPVAGRP
jgi:hypothetical protein